MMTRIDRYIVFEFLRVFGICFATFLGLFVVADFVNHFDEVTRYAEQNDGLANTLYEYYGPKVPWFFDFIGRIVALVASVFAITSLQKNNEMAAMMAAGISRWRIVKPLVLGVVLLAILAALNREFLIPRLGGRVYQDARNLGGQKTEGIRAQYDNVTDIFFDGVGINLAARTIEAPHFVLPQTLATPGTQVIGKEATHTPAIEGRPAGYLVHEVDSKRTAVQSSLRLGERSIVLHPRDTKWLRPDQVFIVSDLPFEQLRDRSHWKQSASTSSLIRAARNKSLDMGADVSVAIHARCLQPIVDVLIVFLGLPIVLSRESRNAFIAVGSCMLTVGIFVVAVLGMHNLGASYLLSPSFAVWLPLMIFVPIAVWISEPLRR